jgi:predicted transposase YbfD/YdcC
MLKKTVETVIATGNHILVQPKGNQPSLQACLVEHAHCHPPADRAYACDLGQRNRIEQRTAEVWPLTPGLGTEPWHDHFQALIRVHRQTERFSTKLKEWTGSEETAYYLCDQPLSAAQFNQVIRADWSIENRLHHVRDTRLDDDASRIRCNPGIFAKLRSFALNLLRFNGVENISLGMYDNALSLDSVLAYRGL